MEYLTEYPVKQIKQKGESMKKFLFLVTVMILANTLLSDQLSISCGDLTIIKNGKNSYTKIELDESSNERGVNGAPALPFIEKNYIIPNGMEISSYNITIRNSVEYKIDQLPYPEQNIVPNYYYQHQFIEPIDSLYSGNYPNSVVETVDYGFIAGNLKVAKIRFNCVKWSGSDSTLTHYKDIDISLNYSPKESSQLCDREVIFRRDLETYKAYIKAATSNGDQYIDVLDNACIIDEPINEDYFNYLIVVPDNFYNNSSLAEFVEWKKQKGNFVKVMKQSEIPYGVDDIGGGDVVITDSQTGFEGDPALANRSASLRKFLRKKFECYGLSYLLIIGDENNSPIMYGNWDNKTTYSDIFHDPWYYYYTMVSDHYFGDMNGDWDVDGAEDVIVGPNNETKYYALFGEPGDDIDRYTDLFVGRVIVPDDKPKYLENWVHKTIKYEKDPGSGNREYLKKALYASESSVALYGGDSANVSLYLGNSNDFSVTNLADPLGAEFVSKAVNTNPNLMFINSHGQKELTGLKSFENVNGDKVFYSLYSLDEMDGECGSKGPESEQYNGIDNISVKNGQYPIFTVIACRTGAFWDNWDRTTGIYNQSQANKICMPESFLGISPNAGGPLYFGFSGQGHVGSSSSFVKNGLIGIRSNYFNTAYNTRNSAVNCAIGRVKDSSHLHILSTTVYGDPELSMWCKGEVEDLSVEILGENVYRSNKNNSMFVFSTGNGYVSKFTNDGFVTMKEPFNSFTVFSDNCIPRKYVLHNKDHIYAGNKEIDYSIIINSGAKLILASNTTISLTPSSEILVYNGKLKGNENSSIKSANNHINKYCIVVKEGGSSTISNINIEDFEKPIILEKKSSTRLKNLEIKGIASCIDAISADFSVDNINFKLSSSGVISDSYCIKAVNCYGIIKNSFLEARKRGVIAYNSNIKMLKNNVTNQSVSTLFISGRGSNIDLGSRVNSLSVIENNKFLSEGSSNIIIDNFSSINLYRGYNDILLPKNNGNGKTYCIMNQLISEKPPISAQYNYWGNNGNIPQNNWFYPSALSGWIDFSNYSLTPFTNFKNERVNKDYSSNYELYRNGLLAVEDKEFEEAFTIFNDLIVNSRNSGIWEFSISEMYNLEKTNFNNLDRFISTLDSLENKSLYEEKIINEFIFRSYLDLESYDNAERILNIISEKDSTYVEHLYTRIDRLLLNKYSRKDSRDDNNQLDDLLYELMNGKRFTTSSNIENNIPKTLSLSQNYPNPFNPTTTISFNLPMESNVKLEVYNTKGEMVKNLLNGSMKSGTHSIQFDGSNLSSGVYYYILESNSKTITKKMVLLK